MAWIELHSTVREHYKTYALAEALRAARCTAVGIVCSLWAWAIDNAQDGDLSRFPPAAISAACCWDKKPDILISALKSSGYVDDDMRIHDWMDYAGRLVEQREHANENKKRSRGLYVNMDLTRSIKERDGSVCQYCGRVVNWLDRKGALGGTYDHVDPNGDNSLENVVVCCRSCNSSKRDRTPAEANMPFIQNSAYISYLSHLGTVDRYGRFISDKSTTESTIKADKKSATVPNQTVPNQTVPNHNEREGADAPMHAHENDPSVIVPEYHPPANIERVQEYARAIAAPPSFDAQAFIDYYAAQGWKRKGTPITDWRPLVRSWIRNERNMPRRETQEETTADYYLRRVREAEENECNGNAGGEAADDPLGYLSALL